MRRRVFEIGLNSAVIIVALMMGRSLINRFYFESTKPMTAVNSPLSPGVKLQINDIDFSESEQNLLLVLSTTCRYCSESMPFYRSIATLNSERRRLRMIGVFSGEMDASIKFLTEYELALDRVIKAGTAEIKVAGTPTLVLTNRDGVVLDVWYGKLKPDREKEFMNRFFGEGQLDADNHIFAGNSFAFQQK